MENGEIKNENIDESMVNKNEGELLDIKENLSDNEITLQKMDHDSVNVETEGEFFEQTQETEILEDLSQEYLEEQAVVCEKEDECAKDELLEDEGELGYYKESFSNSKKKKSFGFTKLAAVSIVSSILGGLVVGCFLQFASPVVTPKVSEYLNKVTGNKFPAYVMNTSADGKIVKKIEIEKTDSPVVAIAQKVGPSVVGIKSTVKTTNFFFGESESTPQGSGIIIRSDGYIMTNNHVIADAVSGNSNTITKGSKIQVFLPNQQDAPYDATVIGRDEKTDLAVIKIEVNNLPALEFGDSDDVKVGELAVAIGNPGGLEYMGSVTAGIISGVNRTFSIGGGKELKFIQTDAAINPGNSGGALVNNKGQLIGINTAKIGGEGFEGLGFAIPVNKAKEITKDLIEFKYVKGRPLLGITADSRYTEAIAKENNYPVGVLVADVTLLSGAYRGGIQKGDVITKFDGKSVKTVDEINEQKKTHKPGDEVQVEVYREGKYITLKVKLTEEGAANAD